MLHATCYMLHATCLLYILNTTKLHKLDVSNDGQTDIVTYIYRATIAAKNVYFHFKILFSLFLYNIRTKTD